MPSQNNLVELTNQVVELLPIAEFEKQSADSTAGTTTAETTLAVVGNIDATTIPIGNMLIGPSGNLTASASNYATLSIYKRTGGGSQTLLAQCTTQTTQSGGTGSWQSWTPITVAAQANAFVTPGDVVTFAIGKTASGVTVPACVIQLMPGLQ